MTEIIPDVGAFSRNKSLRHRVVCTLDGAQKQVTTILKQR